MGREWTNLGRVRDERRASVGREWEERAVMAVAVRTSAVIVRERDTVAPR